MTMPDFTISWRERRVYYYDPATNKRYLDQGIKFSTVRTTSTSTPRAGTCVVVAEGGSGTQKLTAT